MTKSKVFLVYLDFGKRLYQKLNKEEEVEKTLMYKNFH